MTDLRHFLDIDDFTAGEVAEVLTLARELRSSRGMTDRAAPLTRKSLGMVFEKPSTRTRVSFEAGMTELGGHAIFLGPDDTQLGRGEPLKDTARALSGYVDGIMARVFDHANILELAEYASIPVINGLTDDAHPCQTLADLLTIQDQFGDLSGRTAAWVGDGNNVARSFAIGCAMMDIDLRIATPTGYGVGEDVRHRARTLGREPTVTADPYEAIDGAEIIYTDVWVSMGEEDDGEDKMTAFDGFQINADLLKHALDEAVAMHCLPAHRGEEITNDVLESDRAIVWQQAENRLHAQKGLLHYLLA